MVKEYPWGGRLAAKRKIGEGDEPLGQNGNMLHETGPPPTGSGATLGQAQRGGEAAGGGEPAHRRRGGRKRERAQNGRRGAKQAQPRPQVHHKTPDEGGALGKDPTLVRPKGTAVCGIRKLACFEEPTDCGNKEPRDNGHQHAGGERAEER